MISKLNKKIIIKGQITALSGISIGASNTAMGIGGVDKVVIRNPVTKEPYIPGSSLKGKMRSLFELRNGTIGNKEMGAVKSGPTEDSSSNAAKLFGTANSTELQRPSRLIVRDAVLSQEQISGNFFKDTDLLFTEVKTEVVIDRITSRAMPRQIERVPAGAIFNFELILNVFEGENEDQLLTDTFDAVKLVENDYIGGSGSRGSGQVTFSFSTVEVLQSSKIIVKTDEYKKYWNS